MHAGAVTASGAVFTVKVTNGPVRVAVDTDPELSSPTFFGPESVDGQGVAKVSASGLDPATRYWWQVEDDGLLETPALFLPGVAGDYARTGHDDALNVAADLDVRADVQIDDWSDAAPDTVRAAVAGKWESTGSQRSWYFAVESAGNLRLGRSENGSTIINHTSTAVVPSGAGRIAVRVTLEADDGAGGHAVTFYTAPTMAGPWTQLGDVDTDTGPALLFDGDAELSVGAIDAGASRPFAGRIYQVQVLDGIEGAVVANPRFDEQQPGATVFMENENTWTLLGDAEITGGFTGTFRTLPEPNGPVSFSFAASSCAGNAGSTGTPVGNVLRPERISNHDVFGLLAERAVAEDWAFFHHGGDLHYYDLGSDPGVVPDASVANLRRAVDDVFRQPNQAALMRSVAWSYMDDDHDWVGGNNSHGVGNPDRDAALQVWRERWSHPPLGDEDPDAARYHSFQVGRVLFMVADVRADRDPIDDPDDENKTMLGAAQKAWMDTTLDESDAALVIWLMGSQWQRSSGSDTWAGYTHERAEVAAMFAARGFAGRVLIVQGDAHSNGASTARNVFSHGISVVQFAALDSTPSGPGLASEFDGPFFNQRNQYGVLHVIDDGDTVRVDVEFYSMATLQGTFTFTTPPPFVPSPDFLAGTLSGTHRAVFEARVLTTFQTSTAPAGQVIPVLGGDVSFDATAQVYATVQLETAGHDGKSSLFPRRAGDLLAPYGNEIFVRRGIDLGDRIEWWPLGIFRIDDVEQGPTSGHPIRITGSDRMAGIVDGRLTEPIQFDENDTVGAAVSRLVHDVYPDGLILFDDGSASQRLGRQIIVEEDRYEALRDIVESLGKVARPSAAGALQIMDEPDPGDIVWSVKAGRGGVLVRSGREVSRSGMRNGWVVTGEGAGEQPVRAVVVDAGPNSPTRWGGPFGRVPGFFHTPLVTTSAQARRVAEQRLRRHLGMPYSVNFGSVVNPALRPPQAVRVTQLDGNRERHIVETLTIPLGDGPMTGTTREQTLLDVAQLP